MVADELTRGSVLGLGALVVAGTGVWLARSDRPAGTALLTVHKVVALVCVIAMGIKVFRAFRADSPGLALLALVVACVALVIGSFASGGIVSAMVSAPSWAVWIHRVGTWVTSLAVASCWWAVAQSSI